MSPVGLFPIGVVVHLGRDQPRAVVLALEDPKGAVVPHLDLPTGHQPLPLDLQMCRHQDDVGGQYAERGFRRSLQRPSVEVVVRKESGRAG